MIDTFNNYSITIGIVKNTNDPAQEGRLQVYCPSIDHEDYELDDLPWCRYSTPFGGVVDDLPRGPNGNPNGTTAYGFWAIPKIGAQVLILHLNSDSNHRIWFSQLYPLQGNRSLPGGRDTSNGPFGNDASVIQPLADNMKAAGLSSDLLRGPYERSVGQASTIKDGGDGYTPNPSDESSLDPQCYSFTTPGGHMITMHDDADYCRIRLRTTTGHQVIMDDTNDFIYVSTNKGKTWLEMSSSGKIYTYAQDGIHMSTDGSLDLNAKKDVNIQAGENINIKSGGLLNIDSSKDLNLLSAKNLNTKGKTTNIVGDLGVLITSKADVDIFASGMSKTTASQIHLNTAPAKPAAEATGADSPDITPTHEPFTRSTPSSNPTISGVSVPQRSNATRQRPVSRQSVADSPVSNDSTVVTPLPGGTGGLVNGEPRGIRNNNPGNIKLSGDNWQGLSSVQPDPTFFTFTEAKWGIRAISVIMRVYRDTHNIYTIEDIVNRYAPPSENETNSYVGFVENETGIPRDQILTYNDTEKLLITMAIIKFENGVQPYSAEEILEAINLAGW